LRDDARRARLLWPDLPEWWGVHPGLTPYQSAPYQNMVIFMDRAAPLSALIDLNGGSSNLSISGTIYASHTILKLNGGASDTISAQLIVWNFQLNGNGSSLTVNYNPANLFKLSGTGLVQ
jgi:hypothetical protein